VTPLVHSEQKKSHYYSTLYFPSLFKKNCKQFYVFSSQKSLKYFSAAFLILFAKFCDVSASNFFSALEILFGPLLGCLANNSAIWQQGQKARQCFTSSLLLQQKETFSHTREAGKNANTGFHGVLRPAPKVYCWWQRLKFLFIKLFKNKKRDSDMSFSTFNSVRQLITPRPQINNLKYFQILFRAS
jgi:hypothetical protein